MTVYSVHIRDTGAKPDLALVRDGFSWGAAMFGFLWALFIGAWDLALVLFAVQAVSGALIPLLIDHAGAQAVAQLGVAALIGLAAGEARRALLDWRGVKETGVVTGPGRDQAERRFLDTHPDLAANLLRAA